MAKDFQEVRRDILDMYERVQNENYYEILGVDKEADAAMINSQHRMLVKEWHVDKFNAYDLGADKQKVQEIFAYINNAQRTLTNEEARDEYDMEIHDGPDLVSILNSENAFRTGKNFLNSGSYKGAFENFKEAYESNPDEVQYEAYFLYTQFLLEEKDQTGVVVNKALSTKVFNRLDEIHQTSTAQKKDWLLAFMGTVALGLGKDREAYGLFREALYMNPQNRDAKRQLRLIEIRKRKKPKGVLDKIKSFFAK
jgi:curved DNA-binding protein CbpA